MDTSSVFSRTMRILIIISVLIFGGVLFWVYSTAPGARVTTVLPHGIEDETLEENPLRIESEPITINPAIAAPFSINELSNLAAVEKEFGVTFSEADKKHLQQHKFILKPITESTLAPVSVGENLREFVSIYDAISGENDIKTRTLAQAPFISTDAIMHLFSVLSVELLKETENTYLYPQVRETTKSLYMSAVEKQSAARGEDEKKKWAKVRNYFAVPYALLSTVEEPVTAEQYWESNRDISYEEYQAAYRARDERADTRSRVIAFAKDLGLDAESQKAVLADIAKIYDAPAKDVPAIFSSEYKALAGDIDFAVPFSLFTVRGTYTSSSLRRQYFRAVQWYQQIPFFTRSKELTDYAVAIGELLHEQPETLTQYDTLGELITELVGESDDLDAGDYARAVEQLGAQAYDEAELAAFLTNRKPAARIKGMPAFYSTIGVVAMKDVMNATRGMRFFSQKFIPDSYWTGRLTQGDEAPDVEGMQLPRSASSVEVMTILGSEYARTQLDTLPFYPTHKKAIDTRIEQLTTEAYDWGPAYWEKNQVTGILSTITTLFTSYSQHRAELPQFMRSPLWGAKTLMTASGFWTELRHTNILYAKQSFAEKGGGGDDGVCDTRVIPQPVYGYVEPQRDVYAQLERVAFQLSDIYSKHNIQLKNAERIKSYRALVGIVHEYATAQLQNTAFTEQTMSKSTPLENDPACVQTYVSPSESIKRGTDERVQNADGVYVGALSHAEELRRGIVQKMIETLPASVEGPILPIKDKRAAVIADIHTSDEGIVEEGTGAPFLIFVAVKDSNGARLTTGLTYSHYEFLSEKRLTDEEWQERFYTDAGGDYQITYKPYSSWPHLPVWYQGLLGR